MSYKHDRSGHEYFGKTESRAQRRISKIAKGIKPIPYDVWKDVENELKRKGRNEDRTGQ